MMFKAIYKHTKPLKHKKNMQILTNYINATRFSKFLADDCLEALVKNSQSHILHAPSYGCFRLLQKYKTS